MIDKRLLVDSVTVILAKEKDKWGKVTNDLPITVSPVRFDRHSQSTGTANHRSYSKNSSVIFIYPKHCPVNIDDSWLNAKVSDGSRTYTITGIVEVFHPLTKKIFCYEVEVV